VPHTVVPIPDHVPDDRALFMEPLACCIRALDRVSLKAGHSCLIVGVGAVGVLFMPLLASTGVLPIAADMRTTRLAVATEWGAAATVVPGMDDIANLCRQHSAGRGVDCVVLTIVTADTLTLALAAVRDGGTIILFGGKPGSTASLPLWDIWLREINLVSSYSATPGGLRRAMHFLASRRAEGLETLISHRLPLARAQEAFDLVYKGEASKAVLTP
jgi:L-iditol 2-dehydrogenase